MTNQQEGVKMPAPRLQLRWAWTIIPGESICHYELVLPLDEFDCRRGDTERREMPVSLGETKSTGPHMVHRDAPFRDGAHCKWDSKRLGNLPVYLIGEDGISSLYNQEVSPESAREPVGELVRLLRKSQALVSHSEACVAEPDPFRPCTCGYAKFIEESSAALAKIGEGSDG